jgi:hypothetical protein
MQFDKGNTVFDLQATTVTDPHELFDRIRESHIRHREERDIMREMWENESVMSTHHSKNNE